MDALKQWLINHVTPVYSPALELLSSLHVLSAHEHHLGRLAWAEEMLQTLSAHSLQEFHYCRALSTDFLEIMDAIKPWQTEQHSSVEASIEYISSLTDFQFSTLLLGPTYHSQKVERWLHKEQDELFYQLKPEHREMIKHPFTAKERFCNFLVNYWELFAKEQRRIEPWLIRSVFEIQDQLQTKPLEFIESIHPRFRIHSSYVEFHKATTHRFYYNQLKHIYLIPSTFIAPHLLLGSFPSRISVGVDVNIPCTPKKGQVPLDFIRIMKALGDPTRVAILKNLLDHPHCIQQLASLHGITEPAVSKHIKLLQEAGLVWSERRGYYVFYSGISARLEMLTVNIHEFLDMPKNINREVK